MTMVNSMIITIHEMKHHIRTTFGDLTTHMSCHTWQVPIARVSQGNGAGPQIWVAVSSPMLDIMQTAGHIQYGQEIGRVAFVDNMDLCVYGPHITSPNV